MFNFFRMRSARSLPEQATLRQHATSGNIDLVIDKCHLPDPPYMSIENKRARHRRIIETDRCLPEQQEWGWTKIRWGAGFEHRNCPNR